MKIEFKNGSKIESIECFEGRAGHRKAVYFIGKPTLKTRWLDFILKVKSYFKFD